VIKDKINDKSIEAMTLPAAHYALLMLHIIIDINNISTTMCISTVHVLKIMIVQHSHNMYLFFYY
jgi:hypothetical protein